MSHLLYKTRCPKCAENGKDRHGDNLGVYSDGHTYCFSCGPVSGPTLSGRLAGSTKTDKEAPPLPEDITNQLSLTALDWLLKYFPEGNFPQPVLWSDSEHKLYFLLPNGCYQYRYFGGNADHPKWVGYGINDRLLHIVGQQQLLRGNGLVLVEDLLSACKVGHITPAMPLFGSHIGLKRLSRIAMSGVNRVIIWLDDDKKDYSIKAAKEAAMLGFSVSVIHTPKDPKEYSYQEIASYLDLCYTDDHKVGISPIIDEGEVNECTSTSPAKPDATRHRQGIQPATAY